MNSEILVAAGGTVTIDTEEYRRLVENTAYLNMILAFVHDPKAHILSDICCIVDDLVKSRVMAIGDEAVRDDAPSEESDDAE